MFRGVSPILAVTVVSRSMQAGFQSLAGITAFASV